MKLKICGLSKTAEVDICVANEVEFCGFILNYPKSHRYVSFDMANNLTKINKQKSKYVGVLVKPSDEELKKFSKLNLDYFQLYGDYDDEALSVIKNKFKIKIISSIQVKRKIDVQNYKKIEKESDIILWDSTGYEESVSWNFDWIKSATTNREKMIAGNINIEKLTYLANLTDIVDVSGALETNKVKDINKIKKFIDEVKKINYEN